MGTENDRKIGERVARLRTEKGMSQAAVAEAMRAANSDHKWSQATVWALEKGDRPLRAAEVADLSNVIGGGQSMYTHLDPSRDHLQKAIALQHEILNASRGLQDALSTLNALAERIEKFTPQYRRWTDKYAAKDRDWARLGWELDELDISAERIKGAIEHCEEPLAQSGEPNWWHYLAAKDVKRARHEERERSRADG